MAEKKDLLLNVLGSEEFEIFYKKHLISWTKNYSSSSQENQESYDLLQSHLEKIQVPECYISVLGIQGAGKSSLLNSLLFGEDILPVEVEETTCIPTMIRRVYKGEKPGALVYYRDERVEQIPLKREFLEKVVDNRYNPGNIMDATYVVCKADIPLLKEGFVFVDLPGVGSSTEKNEETTMRFLQETHIGIFMLRTVPPITESEGSFIDIAWPRLQESLFVQNMWARETEKEVKEGMEHNKKVLEKIAQKRNTKPPEDLIPVNVAMACQASYSHDEEGMAQSGLNEIKEYIRAYAKGAALDLRYRKTASFFLRLISKAKENIESRLDLLQTDRKDIKEKLREARSRMEKISEEMQLRIQASCENFLSGISTVKTDWLSERLEKATEDMLEKMDRLPLEDYKEDPFRQEVREQFSESFGILYQQFKEKLAQTAEEYVKNLGESLQQLSSPSEILQEGFSVSSKEKRGASGWSVLLSGAIAPMVITGPVGWSILGGAMLTGGLVRWISGTTAHKRILQGLRKALGDGKRQIRKELLSEIDSFSQSVITSIQESIQNECSGYLEELQKREADLQKKQTNQKEQKDELQQDIKLASMFIEYLSSIIH